MEQRTTSPYPRRDRALIAVVGLLLLASAVLFTWREGGGDWRYYQYEFRQLVAEKFGEDKLDTIPAGLQQIWVPALGRADRCVTCHQAVTWRGLETADEPFRTHAADLLRTHPIQKFGCTPCHGGQGWAVDVLEAHGPVQHWEEPVLGSVLGDAYSLVDQKSALMEMNCNACHRYERETRGATTVNLAKALVAQKGCRACHVVNGRGGSIGPDLTFVGDKAPEQYDYSRLSGQRTVYAWHVAHLKEPKALVAESVMPMFGFSTREAQALSVLLMSWRRTHLPAEFVAGVPRVDVQSAQERADEERMNTGPGAWFVKTGCFVCHSISVFGVKSPAQIGPDLSNAVEDVQKRFGRTIDDFLAAPTGTMSVVLSRQIILTNEQKASAIARLREAFEQYQRRLPAQAARPGN